MLVDTDEKALNVNLEKKQIRSHYSSEVANSFVGAPLFTAGVRMENKHFFPDGFQMSDKQMVNDSVAEICRPNLAQFWIGNCETDRTAGFVVTAFQFPFKAQKFSFKSKFKLCRMKSHPFVPPAIKVGLIKVSKRKMFGVGPTPFLVLSLTSRYCCGYF